MPILDLGKVRFSFKGDWSVGSAYEYYDMVHYNHNSYVCNTLSGLSAGGSDPVTDAGTNWVKMAEGIEGADGDSIVSANVESNGHLNLTLQDRDLKSNLDSQLWLKPAAAPIVQCYPVPESPIDVLVTMEPKETAPASGDKGPANPSKLSGVSNVAVTTCGKNLFPKLVAGTFTKEGITLTVDSDGTLHLNGTKSSSVTCVKFVISDSIKFPTGTYTLSLNNTKAVGTSFSNSISIYYNSSSYLSCTSINNSYSFNETYIKSFNLYVHTSETISDLIIKPQLELGSTSTSYEQYTGNTYTFSLGSELPGATLDLSTGKLTQTWIKYVLTGNENWKLVSDVFIMFMGDQPYAKSQGSDSGICSHFIFGAGNDHIFTGISSVTGKYITYKNNITSPAYTVDTWKEFLSAQYAAGTPVVVMYKLATPIVTTLTPQQVVALTQSDRYTPRLNTVYSDASSVTVGYAKSPIRANSDIKNAIIALGGTL